MQGKQEFIANMLRKGASARRVTEVMVARADRTFPLARNQCVAQLAYMFKMSIVNARAVVAEFWV